MEPGEPKATTPAEQAAADESAAQEQKDIHIRANVTVGQAEGSHVTGAIVDVSDAQSVQVGDRQNITNQAPNQAAQGNFYGPVYVGTSSPAPIDPVAAAQLLAALPLEMIPDLAALPPLSRMPLSRNPLFVGREADLKHLAATLKGGGTAAIGQIAAATGLGGIGKTNLASEFVHRYGQFFAGGVFWLSFADAAAVPSEIAACGVGLGLPDFADLKLDAQVALVRQTWQQPIPRLLIFDNCEDEALLDQWRPTSGGCRVLMTSRRARWDVALGLQVLALGVLSRSESIALLRLFRPDLAPDDLDLSAIANELGDLPLALHLAGSYLARYRQVVTLAEYLTQLRSPALLQHRSLRLAGVSPTGHDHDVGRTFALSYNRLDSSNPTDTLALALLVRAAYFAPGEPISRELLLATVELAGDDAVLTAEDALVRLVELGLLERAEAGTLTLHRLLVVFVQAVVQDEDALAAVEQGIFAMANRLSHGRLPALFLALQGHMRYVTDRAMGRDDQRVADLCSTLESYLSMIGEYHGARPYAERALTIRRKVQGEQHPDTATSLNNLGTLLYALGDLSGAWPYLEQALAIRQKVLGERHPDTANSLSNLGLLFKAQGELSAARPYLEQALAIDEVVYGRDHPDVATDLNNLGSLLQDMGELSAAQPYLEQALEIVRKVLGDEHPDTASSLNNLGTLLYALGDLSAAQLYLEQALAIRQKVQGEQHPDTAVSLNNLGMLLQDVGDLSAARSYYEQVLVIRRKVLGDEHPDTASSLNNLGTLFQDAGDLSVARSYYEQALAIDEVVYGHDHPDVATDLNNLGSLFQDAGDLSVAWSYYEQALVIKRTVLGEEHPSTTRSLNNLGSLLWDMGDLSGARPYLEQALVIKRKVLGEEHPSTATSLNNLGTLLSDVGDLRGARPLYEQALAIRRRVLGEEHPNTAFSLNNLGSLLKDVGDLSAARPLYEQALAIYERVLGPDHPNTQVVRRNLAGLDAPAQTPAQQADAAD